MVFTSVAGTCPVQGDGNTGLIARQFDGPDPYGVGAASQEKSPTVRVCNIHEGMQVLS